MFLFPFEDVHTRNHESFPINFRSSPVTIDGTSHLAATLVQEVPADSGNFPWYMTDSIAVLEDSYSEVVVNVIDLALNWQLFSDVGRPRSFVNVMSTNSTLDPERRRHSYLKGIPLCSDRVKLLEGGLIFETNCILEYKPSPHFRLDVVYKMGGAY